MYWKNTVSRAWREYARLSQRRFGQLLVGGITFSFIIGVLSLDNVSFRVAVLIFLVLSTVSSGVTTWAHHIGDRSPTHAWRDPAQLQEALRAKREELHGRLAEVVELAHREDVSLPVADAEQWNEVSQWLEKRFGLSRYAISDLALGLEIGDDPREIPTVAGVTIYLWPIMDQPCLHGLGPTIREVDELEDRLAPEES